ncbi:MAG: N-6 DNA methylase [Planctomycetaceae bacterium]|jgi:predicted RNA methylase|nr:N-6 DNA methylase [Planctomycetaceae bacterium]
MKSQEILATNHEQYRSQTPHVRKADGVYYTPKSIVESVVQNSVGKLIADKTVPEVAKIKIVDPACGCGNFLVAVYQYLLDWHTKQKASTLTLKEKQSILKNNIFGVDIDSGAVEITKQSLSTLCSGNGSTHQHHTNIKVGNSLIDTDFNTDTNTFDWETTFPAAIRNGGFDIVIGNPPWGQKAVKFTKEERAYFAKKYPASSVGNWDLFRFFVEKSITILKPNGILAQVLPDIILLKNYETTRRLILDNTAISQIDHWGTPFKNVNIEVCSIVATKRNGSISEQPTNSTEIKIHKKDKITFQNKVNQNIFNQLRGKKFNILLTDTKWQIIKKLSANPTFGGYFDIHEGIHTGNVRNKLFVDSKLNENCKKVIIGGGEVKRNELNWNGKWVHYTKEILTSGDYAGLGKQEYFERKKIVIRRTGDYVLACLDEDGYYFSNNVFICLPKTNSIDMNFYLTILNSNLITWYYQTIHPQVGQLFPEIKINVIKELPICKQPNKSDIKTLTDQAIYKLYGLTKEEIDICEDNFKNSKPER